MSMSDTPHSEAAAREDRLARLIEATLRLHCEECCDRHVP